MDFVADTTLLIGLWKERRKAGPATRFAGSHAASTIHLPWISKAEFLRGALRARLDRDETVAFLGAFRLQWPGERTLEIYAQIWVDLAGRGLMIGPNDLWIAAAGMEKNLAVLTRNTEEFQRVTDLKVIDYTER